MFGRDAVLKELEPVKAQPAHELGLVVEGVAPTDALAEKITDFATRMFFLARIPGVKGTAGTAATTKKTMKSSPGYMWNVEPHHPDRRPAGAFPRAHDGGRRMKLGDLASTIRSKNAGVNQITFDIIFPDRKTYERAVRSAPLRATRSRSSTRSRSRASPTS